MRRILVFRLALVCIPFILLLLVASFLEIGTRLYYYSAGLSINAFRQPIQYKTQITDPLPRRLSIPSHLHKRPQFKEIHFEQLDQATDASQAFLPVIFTKGVISLLPNASQNLIKRFKSSGEIVYDVLMETDAVGRRVTPLAKLNQHPTEHLIFYGCSYTIGEGVQANETIPYYTAATTKNYRAYNLGINGGNISEAWAYTNITDSLREIREQKGKAIYIFIDDHVLRYKGSIQHLGTWVFKHPLVRPEHDGTVRHYGKWVTAHPLLSNLSRVLIRSYFLNLIKFNFPPIEPQDLEDFVKVIHATKQGYLRKFGEENSFIVVFYPSHSMVFASTLIPLLEKAGIQYIDYSHDRLETLSEERLFIHGDGHPNALAHKIMGEQIAEDLKLE